MFCIKCGMMLDNSAKSCPACGTKMVFPEGFTPDGSPSPAPKAEVVLSNEPPHAPDDFDLSKANITYNGKTMLINDEPEIDLDMTMAAPVPRAPQAPSAPVYSQPVYQAPSSYIPSPVPEVQAEESDEAEAPKSKSKMPLIIGISIAVLIVAVVAIVMLVGKGGDKNENNAPSSPTVSSIAKPENSSLAVLDPDVDAEPEVILIEYSEAPSEDLVYIVREKDSEAIVITDSTVGYLESDALAAEYAASNEKAAKKFIPFEKIEELKEAVENGDVNAVLISEELSEQIISKKENNSDAPDPSVDETYEHLGDTAEEEDSDEEEADDTAAPTKPDEAPSEAVTDIETTVASTEPPVSEEN